MIYNISQRKLIEFILKFNHIANLQLKICQSSKFEIRKLYRNLTSRKHFLCLAFLVRNLFTNKQFLRILFLIRLHFISNHSNTCTNRQRVTNIQNEHTLRTEQPSTTLL